MPISRLREAACKPSVLWFDASADEGNSDEIILKELRGVQSLP
jgi:hypothetical protein